MKTITLTKVETIKIIEKWLEYTPVYGNHTEETDFDINTESIIYYYDNYVVTARLIGVPNTNLRLNEVIEVKQTREEIKQLINEQHN